MNGITSGKFKEISIFLAILLLVTGLFEGLGYSAEPERHLARADILDDPLNRINTQFHVPRELKKRTSFWFDVYTKYTSQHHVIHHTRYPWVVYEVVDTSKILNGPGRFWTKWHKAKRHVKTRRWVIGNTLRKLSKRRSYKNLKGLQKRYFNQLKWIKGRRKSVFRMAAKNIRSQTGLKDSFLSGLVNSTKYLAHMEEEFTKEGLPLELTRLPFVESSFNERAQSRVGASGIWQIMPRTGKAYGGIVSRFIDERNSPLKATNMAASLLKQDYKFFKSWPLAVTAYNHGIGGLNKAIRRSRTRKLHEIIERYHRGSFKFASSNFLH